MEIINIINYTFATSAKYRTIFNYTLRLVSDFINIISIVKFYYGVYYSVIKFSFIVNLTYVLRRDIYEFLWTFTNYNKNIIQLYCGSLCNFTFLQTQWKKSTCTLSSIFYPQFNKNIFKMGHLTPQTIKKIAHHVSPLWFSHTAITKSICTPYSL